MIGALLYIAYFAIYSTVPVLNKENFLLELTATVFPLVISIVTGLNSSLEERASHFQCILSSKKRISIWNGKLIFLILTGLFSIQLLMITFWLGVKILAISDISLLFCVNAGFILFACNIVIYIWHLFLSYRFGIGFLYSLEYLKVCRSFYTAILLLLGYSDLYLSLGELNYAIHL